MEAIYGVMAENNPHEILIVRTRFAITFVSQFPYRHVQVCESSQLHVAQKTEDWHSRRVTV